MPKFLVTVNRTAYQVLQLEVEAEDELQAERQAEFQIQDEAYCCDFLYQTVETESEIDSVIPSETK